MSRNARGQRRRRALTSAVAVSAVGALAAAALAAAPFSNAAVHTASHHGLDPAAAHASAVKAAKKLPKKVAGSILDSRITGMGIDTESMRGAPKRGPIAVMLELDDAPATTTFAARLSQGRPAAVAAARAQTARIKASQAQIKAAFGKDATKAHTLYTTHAAYAGIAVTTDVSKLPALAALPGVKAVHRLTPKTVSNSTTVPMIGASNVWAGNPRNTGVGVRIGIIDTGVDYTHAMFGGAGTAAAYDAAHAAQDAPVSWPQGAVVGGYDFAGDSYYPNPTLDSGAPNPDYQPNPAPDANPLDCEGHGSHVAGTAAGRGVAADGSTFAGPYRADMDPATFRIGPGVAPAASIYALKVFGCDGSTNLTSEALDWAADPNGDGDVSDHLDVVNMSLGSDFASPDDPDAVASNNLSAIGTVVVAAAGNAGDVADVSGSPGNAARVIGVAASDDPVDVLDGLKVDSPDGVETPATQEGPIDNVFAASESVAYDWANDQGVSNTPVVTIGDWSAADPAASNADGCSPLSTADAAEVAGKILLTKWLDGSFRCGSVARAANAAAAGAKGVIYGTDTPRFSAGFTGSATLPAMGITSKGTTALVDAIKAGPVNVTMTNALHNGVQLSTPSAKDQIASFSSRGFGTNGNLKPDVTAPGVSVFSTDVGTGTQGVSENGTSMATPHIAGVAALVRKAHPTWSVEQVKAAIMNTAGVDVKDGSLVESAVRQGAGRVQADRAVVSPTLAYVKDDAGVVGVSWGSVSVGGTATLSKKLHVVNTTTTAHSYSLSYSSVLATPGASVSVSPSSISLAAGASTDVTVSVRLSAQDMRHTLDPTMDDEGGYRSFFSEVSGRIAIKTSHLSGTTQVPVYLAPHPATIIKTAASVDVTGTGDVQGGWLSQTGHEVAQGESDENAYVGEVSSFELQGTSPKRPTCSATVVIACSPYADERAGDLKYVGFASDAPYLPAGTNPFHPGADLDPQAYFAVSTWGPWRTPASYAEYDVYIDTNRDGVADLAAYNTRNGDTSDTMLSVLVDLSTGDVVDDDSTDYTDGIQLLNGMPGSFDSQLFNSDSMFLPVSLRALGNYLPGSATRVNYWVQAGTIESGNTDRIGSASDPLSVDVVRPAITAKTVGPAFPIVNYDGTSSADRLAVRRDSTTFAADKPLGLLTLHHLNPNGSKAQVTKVAQVTPVSFSVSNTSYAYGGRPFLRASVPADATGTIGFLDGTKFLGRGTISNGKVEIVAPVLARGTHHLQAVYNGDSTHPVGRSSLVTVTVR